MLGDLQAIAGYASDEDETVEGFSSTTAAAAVLSSTVGVEIWSSPCRPRFGGSTNEFWCCITTSRTCDKAFGFVSIVEADTGAVERIR